MTTTKDLALGAMPGTLDQIAAIIDRSSSSVATAVKALRDDEACHIGDWVLPDGGKPTAVHHAGPGEDAVCELRYVRPKKMLQKGVRIPPRDAITTALFGPA